MKENPRVDPNFKAVIVLDGKEDEKKLIAKIRSAYRKAGVYGKSVEIAKTIWESGSLEAKDMQLAIDAAKKQLVTIKE